MEKVITSLRTYIDYIMGLRDSSAIQEATTHQWFFRGQENSSWSIYPNIFRNDGLAKETQTIQSALRQNPFEFQNIKDFEILTKLQHYGLGTRLVDVTLNPLVALYFATAESVEYKENKNGQFSREEKDGAVFVKYSPWHSANDLCIRIASSIPFLEMDSTWTTNTLLTQLNISEADRNMLTRDDNRLLIEYLQNSFFVVSSHSNERLTRQSGAFIIPTFINFSNSADIINSLITKSYDSINDMFSPDRIIIPAKHKKAIREELDFLNINEATLFPELEHQMTYIKQRNVPIVGSVPSFIQHQEVVHVDSNELSYNELIPSVRLIVTEVCATLSSTLRDRLIKEIKPIMEIVDWKQKESLRSLIKVTCKRILQNELSAVESAQKAEQILQNLLSPSEEMSINVLASLSPDEWKKQLSQKLIDVFGKDTFTEEEMTKKFWVELKVKCGDFFKTEDGAFDNDLFWSENFKEWLLAEKEFSLAGIS